MSPDSKGPDFGSFDDFAPPPKSPERRETTKRIVEAGERRGFVPREAVVRKIDPRMKNRRRVGGDAAIYFKCEAVEFNRFVRCMRPLIWGASISSLRSWTPTTSANS